MGVRELPPSTPPSPLPHCPLRLLSTVHNSGTVNNSIYSHSRTLYLSPVTPVSSNAKQPCSTQHFVLKVCFISQLL